MSGYPYGRAAYDAYVRVSGGRSLVSGDELPTWGRQDARIRDAWNRAAQAVIYEYQKKEEATEE